MHAQTNQFYMNTYPPMFDSPDSKPNERRITEDMLGCSPISGSMSGSIPPGYKHPQGDDYKSMDGPAYVGMATSPVSMPMPKDYQKEDFRDRPAPKLNTQAQEICESGFAYLFRDPTVSTEVVEMYSRLKLDGWPATRSNWP